ncbi:DnaJ like chaperone protein [Arsukibacterium tuosuense]|uniref:DnaJ like chaperone protein n=1 Tax=Arsukibacterium tuosuense TaxID=1323745 RepID=A0A285JM61_9GAMM|nr:co-chaperone DjlA [Arsukibacterium tuosuense]SNY60191.1 DnaJ like chaperone protein [Arsukibacterium tuosuense]
MWGKILGALFGLALLRLPGLFIGLILGHWFDVKMGANLARFRGLFNESEEQQGLFMYTTFATMGHIAKATGVVTPAHIRQARHFMQQLGLNEAQQQEAQAAFRDGKASNFPLVAQLQAFHQHFGRQKDVTHYFVEIQLGIANVDGEMSHEQYQLLQQVALQLSVSRLQLEQMLAAYRAQQRFNRHDSKRPSANAMQDAYKVLGVSDNCTEKELKRAYRKLMAQHHPDKLMAKGVPAAMLDVAKRRTQEIQAAYELLKNRH